MIIRDLDNKYCLRMGISKNEFLEIQHNETKIYFRVRKTNSKVPLFKLLKTFNVVLNLLIENIIKEV